MVAGYPNSGSHASVSSAYLCHLFRPSVMYSLRVGASYPSERCGKIMGCTTQSGLVKDSSWLLDQPVVPPSP